MTSITTDINVGGDVTLSGEVEIGPRVSKIIAGRLIFKNGACLHLLTPGLLIKAPVIQGNAVITWPGAGNRAAARLSRPLAGAHGGDATPRSATDYGLQGADGAAAISGARGASGAHGDDAPALRIAYADAASYGCLHIDLRGQDGQDGQDGAHGGYGGAGGTGGPPQLDDWNVGVLVAPGRGGDGGTGGDGGDAGHGGNGGCGGFLTVLNAMPQPWKDVPLTIIAACTGGQAAPAGQPGLGGRGGQAGLGGRMMGCARANERLNSGHPGRNGEPGRSAYQGAPGEGTSPKIVAITRPYFDSIL